MNSKVFNILNPWSFVGLFRIMAAKTLKNSYRLQVLTFKNQNTKGKTESYIFSGFGNSTSSG